MNSHSPAQPLLGRRPAIWLACSALIVAAGLVQVRADEPAPKPANLSTETFPGTKLLTGDADMHVETVIHADRFLDKVLDRSIAARAKFWKRFLVARGLYRVGRTQPPAVCRDHRRARSARHAAACRVSLFDRNA